MHKALVSVIVTVYNTKDFVEACVNSLMHQTYSCIEIIIVDDGSVDGSGELIDSLSQIHPLKVVHKENGGAGSARNTGLELASGEWIIFADCDDIYSKNAIDRLVDICERNQCLLACCGTAVNASDLSQGSCVQSEVKVYDRETGLQKLLEEQIKSYFHSKIYHRSLFAGKMRIPEGMTFEDLYIMPDFFAKANRIAVTSEKLYYYYQNRTGNISSAVSVYHCISLSIAQRHRYVFGCPMLMLPENTMSLLLYRAVRSSLGAYRRAASDKVAWKSERKSIVGFLKRYRQNILRCPTLSIQYKLISLVLSTTRGD